MLTLSVSGHSWAHRLPVGQKLFALLLASIVGFSIENLAILLGFSAIIVMLYLSVGRTLAAKAAHMLKPLLLIVAVLAAYHLYISDAYGGAVVIVKMLSLVALANFVTMTSRLDDMIDWALWVLSPLRWVGLPTKPIAVGFALVVRFVPIMLVQASLLSQAWRARSTSRLSWRVILPLSILALDDADRASQALRARGGIEE